MSPEERMARSRSNEEVDGGDISSLPQPAMTLSESNSLVAEPGTLVNEQGSDVEGQFQEPSGEAVNARTSLLGNYHHSRICGHRNCNHGTFSPRAPSPDSERSTESPFGGDYRDDLLEDGHSHDTIDGVMGNSITDSLTNSKSLSTTRWLARKHGIRSHKWMYFSYYFPFIKWIPQYRWSWFQGDLIAALTMASFYIPLSLSFAANLAHLPPINGLYSFVFGPMIYAFLGSCPRMVVGPEAAGSLLVGQVVKTCIDRGQAGDDDDRLNAQIGGVVTAIAGAVIFTAGLTRLGFLDSVLSRPFLRGFISAIGFVIIVDQLIPELGLSGLAKEEGRVEHGSSAQKIVFLFQNAKYSHRLTAAVSFSTIAITMSIRYVKRKTNSPTKLTGTDLSNNECNLGITGSHISQTDLSSLSSLRSLPGVCPGTRRASKCSGTPKPRQALAFHSTGLFNFGI